MIRDNQIRDSKIVHVSIAKIVRDKQSVTETCRVSSPADVAAAALLFQCVKGT